MHKNAIGIVIGHNSHAQGAVRCTDSRTEFDWNGELAALIKEHDPANIHILRRERGGGYSKEIDRVYAEADRLGCKVTVELHFNGSSNPKANGGLTLSSGTSGSLKLATAIRGRMADVLGNKDRGVQIRKRHDRGGRSLWQGKAPAVMIEPYFGSNSAECISADLHMDEMAEAVYRGCMEYIGNA